MQNEMRSLVNLADGAAGGGTTPASWERTSGPTSSRAAGSSSRSGERGKRSSGSAGRKMTTPSGKKKEEPSGPLLYDGPSELWGGLQVGSHVVAVCVNTPLK